MTVALAGFCWILMAAAVPAPSEAGDEERPEVVAATVDGADRDALAAAVAEGGGDVEWGAIVVHHGGSTAGGSAVAMDRYQREVLRAAVGLVHHFVIGNGSGTADGAVEVTGTWARGVVTPHLFRRGDLPPAIAIALVGDLDAGPPTKAQQAALANLLAALAERRSIPVDRILTHREVEGRGTVCPGKHVRKLDILDAAGILPKGKPRVRVESASGEVELLVGERVLYRFERAGEREAPLPIGSWPVCRRDDGGAFGRTVVLAYPGASEIAAARKSGRLSPDDAHRLQHALAKGRCPPDDTALGGEIAFHAGGIPDEGTACIPLEPRDVDLLFRVARPGTVVEIVP